MQIFTDIILALYHVLFNNLGLTIIVLALASRIIFLPSSISMIRHQKKMQDLKPKLDALKKTHSEDKKRQMEEQAKLFKEHGINPASGCLNAVLQIAIAILLYNALTQILKLPDLNRYFFSWDLTQPDLHKNIISNIALPGVLVIISAITQLVLSKMMAPKKPIVEETKAVVKKKKVVVTKEEKQDFADMATQMQSQMLFLFPAMIIYSGYFLPAGLALYWAITTIFAIIQQYILVGWGGMGDWLPKSIRDTKMLQRKTA